MEERSRVDSRAGAIALAALLSGDQQLSALDLLTPDLARRARRAVAELDGVGASERAAWIEATRARLLTTASDGELRGRWSRAPRAWRPRFSGIDRLVQATLFPCWPPTELSPGLASLHGDQVIEVLARLTTALLRRGARGERWAVRLLARGPAALCHESSIDPRLAPAVVWVGHALAGDPLAQETLVESWPGELGRALSIVTRGVGAGASWHSSLVETLRRELETELASHG